MPLTSGEKIVNLAISLDRDTGQDFYNEGRPGLWEAG